MMFGRTLTCRNDPLTNTRSVLAATARDKTLDQDRIGVALENERLVIFLNVKFTNSRYSEIDGYER